MVGGESAEEGDRRAERVSRPTVDLWLGRYESEGIAGLLDRPRDSSREQVPGWVRARILAATRTSPPPESGLSHWSSREMAAFIRRTEGVAVSHNYVAKLWRETGLRAHRQGTFKVSRDPEFAEKVADIVGLYLEPPGGAVVLSHRREDAGPGAGPHPADAADRVWCERKAHPRLRSARHDEPVRRS